MIKLLRAIHRWVIKTTARAEFKAIVSMYDKEYGCNW